MVDSWLKEKVRGSDGNKYWWLGDCLQSWESFPRAQVKEIDFSKNLAKVKWEISCTTDVVEITNLHPYSTSTTSKQKRIETDFFHHNNQRYKTTANDEKLCDKQTVLKSPVPIRYYSLENTSKFCAEGAVKNLLNMGSTKRTLCGIILFKLNTFFSHVFVCL